MAEKIIEVIQNGTSLQLVPSAPIELRDGDLAWWKFPQELPSDQLGFVFFHRRLGPFHSLRSFSNTVILGKGNNGQAAGSGDAEYDYTAMILQPGAKDPIATVRGQVINRASQVDTAPEVFVTYNPQAPDPAAALSLVPDRLGLNPGDTATWYFANLPDGAFANFHFVPKWNGMQLATGPFVAFSACGGGDLFSVRASGTGFLAGLAPADAAAGEEFTYHLEVRDRDGVLLASHDPAIDNLGPPPPGQTL